MIHLQSITYRKPASASGYPFTVPAVAHLESLTFEHEVTFLVGENGSGKSTLLEAIAVAARLPAVGSEDTDRDRTLASVRTLANALKLAWTKKTQRGFFMRSEDFFGFTRRLAGIREGMERDLQEIDQEYRSRSETARNLARMPFMRELHAMREAYGENLDAYSHGESYFKLFNARFAPGGLYLLDEPEAPLSPTRQLALLAMLKQTIRQDAQFIIATHSPILLAYPGAVILSFDAGTVRKVDYNELEHVTITRSFLNNPELYLRHLFADG